MGVHEARAWLGATAQGTPLEPCQRGDIGSSSNTLPEVGLHDAARRNGLGKASGIGQQMADRGSLAASVDADQFVAGEVLATRTSTR